MVHRIRATAAPRMTLVVDAIRARNQELAEDEERHSARRHRLASSRPSDATEPSRDKRGQSICFEPELIGRVGGVVHTHPMAGTDQFNTMSGFGDRRSCGIAVMAKASVPGRTKTRLTPPLTATEAAACNTAFLKDVSANLLAAGGHAAIHGYMAYGPPGSQQFFVDNLPRHIGLIESWLPNFGDCLFKAINGLFAVGHESAVVLNSDSPTLADGAPGRDRGSARPAGRSRRARSLDRRRLLSSRHQAGAPAFVRRCRLEHRACRAADPRPRSRDRPRRALPAGMVRCRRFTRRCASCIQNCSTAGRLIPR